MDLRLGRASMERLKRKLCSTGESTSAASSSSTFSDEFSDEDEQQAKHSKRKARLIYTLRENPRKSFKLPDPAAVHGGETDTDDQSRNAAPRRRSKRSRRVAADPEPLSSVSDASLEDDAATIAMCLVMLSRDTWPNRRGSREEVPKQQQQHRCEVCDKVFRSSQALGGHRVTHRKLNQLGKFRRKTVTADGDVGGEKIFECPYCFKVFASGQALGGHKRSHNGGAGAPSPESQISLIDLNLPAPEEEDDCSVVSDAETADHHCKA